MVGTCDLHGYDCFYIRCEKCFYLYGAVDAAALWSKSLAPDKPEFNRVLVHGFTWTSYYIDISGVLIFELNCDYLWRYEHSWRYFTLTLFAVWSFQLDSWRKLPRRLFQHHFV